MRGSIYIRIENGKEIDRVTVPMDKASIQDAYKWCEDAGCAVTRHNVENAPDNQEFFQTYYIHVKPKTSGTSK
jgi:hypothetical protein